MAAAQAIVLVVAQQVDRGLRVGLHPALHGGFGAVGGAVIDHDALGDHSGHLTVQQLGEMAEAMPMMAQRTMIAVTDMDLFKLGRSSGSVWWSF